MSEEYEAVVYDLDGTLVRLGVDWDAARTDVANAFHDAGVEPRGGIWEMMDEADDHGVEDESETVLADHETSGARESARLPLADEATSLTVPVGVCSLNCEAACRIALERHDLADAVDAVVGRDTVPEQKPEPEPLLAAIEELGADPSATVFVGDSKSDETAAERAGVDFQWVRSRRNSRI